MKIQLTKNEHEINTTYPDYVPLVVTQLETLPLAGCTDIYLGDICDYVSNIEDFLTLIISKLRYGGKLILSSIDMMTTIIDLQQGFLPMNQAQHLLFNGRTSCQTLLLLTSLLQTYGLIIHKTDLDGYTYYIEAIRPNHA